MKSTTLAGIPHPFDPPVATAGAEPIATFWEQLVPWRPALLRVAYHVLTAGGGTSADVDDVVHNTLMSGLRHRDQFRGRSPGELRAWLKSILVHLARNWLRGYGRGGGRPPMPVVSLSAREAGEGLIAWLPAGTRTPAEELLRDEDRQRLDAARGHLEPHQEAVIRLRFDEDLPFQEIGTRLGCTEDAARKTCGRALARLRRLLEE